MIAQLGGPNTAELSQILQNIVIIQSPVVQASRASWSACPGCWNICTVAKQVASQTNASIAQDRRARARHCRRWLRLTLGDVSRGAAGRRGGRLECALLPGRGRLPHPGTQRNSQMRLSVLFAELFLCCGKPCRTAPLSRPTPSLRPRSPPSSTPPEVCLETKEIDVRRRHGTTTTHAKHSSPKV